jgi:hypothetical protein
MRCTGPVNYILSGSAVLALLAGCSGGGSSTAPTPVSPQALAPSAGKSVSAVMRQGVLNTSVARNGAARISHPLLPSFASPDAAATAAVVVSDAANAVVVAYTRAGTQIAQISGFSEPQGITGDNAGNVYIANTGGSNILVYKNDYKTLLSTLNDPGQFPVGVSVNSADGVVGVTNIIDVNGGPGSVSFYAKGATSPCATVSNSTFGRVYFDAFDGKGNLYIDGQDANGNFAAGVVTGECKAKTITNLTVSNTIVFPGGVQVGPLGNIQIDDQTGESGPVVYTYAPPTKGSLGSPTQTTTLSGAGDPVSISLLKSTKAVWTADALNLDAASFAYPAGGSVIKTIGAGTLGQPIGVLVTPLVQQP